MGTNEPAPEEIVPGNHDLAIPTELRSYDKTPTYSAINWQRYVRQALIREIESDHEAAGAPATLICYVAQLRAQVERTDILGFVDLLHNVPDGRSIDLLLQTPGGDLDAAEKIINVLRKKVGDGAFRVIVPDYAKSVGTLMALAADTIVMSDCSELGPIDPQVVVSDANGKPVNQSVLLYLRAFQKAKKELEDDPENPVAQLTFERFDPLTVQKYEAIKRRTQDLAENQLKPRGTNYTAIVAELMNIDQFPSHSQMIGCERAQQIGLNISYMSMGDPLWRKYWSLYCHLRMAIAEQPGQRLFESSYVSLPW